MPELPDVARFKQYLDSTALHQTITKTRVLDERILSDISPQQLGRRLKGGCLEETARHGKFLFARASQGGWLVLHFGMTGELHYSKSTSPAPDFERVILTFDNDYRLAYISQRMLGRVTFAEDPHDYAEQQNLGPDALDTRLNKTRFQELLAHRRGMVKSALMNQSLIAGIGNIYADEILFQSRLHPKTGVEKLGHKERAVLFDSMRRVLRTATKKLGEVEKLPKSYFLPHRGGDMRCPACGARLQKIKVSNRTSYFCPRCQRAP